MTISPYIQQCPRCSRVITFYHEACNILRCTCGAVIHRKEGGVLLLKPFAVVEEPVELICPGTHGSWKGRSFTVLGRFRAWFTGSVFNYWTILFSDGELCYLGEGYGLYAVFQQVKEDALLSSINPDVLDPGDKKALFKNQEFVLEKKSACTRWEVEGELYLPECNEGFRVCEFSSLSGRHITVFEFLKGYHVSFQVIHTSFAELALTGTREPAFPGMTFTCADCEASVPVKAWPYAQSCACARCGAWYVLGWDGYKKANRKNEEDGKPAILPGSKGTLKGISYEVTGYALKEENNQERAQWNEYTLFNAAEGFAFLSEFEGHWIYTREKGDAPVLNTYEEASFTYEGEPFRQFNRYTYKAVYVQGEFPYNINDTGDTRVNEFISPPEMWILEKDSKEGIAWFLGEHVSRQEMAAAFTFPEGLPPRNGVGAIEPKGYVSIQKLATVTFIAMLVLFFIHFALMGVKKNHVVLENTYTFGYDSVNTVSFVTERFDLDKWRSNVEIDMEAPVDNSWMEMNVTLVNVKDGSEYSTGKEVGYYHGYSEGEWWVEGSGSGTAYLSRIPAGTYVCQVQGMRESSGTGRAGRFSLKVTYDVPNNTNLLFGILALLIWPFIQYWLISRDEASRWYNSPFSPINYED